jgi:glycosyltransferase involved in cell wall biosynthesis
MKARQLRILFVGHSYITRMAQGKLRAMSQQGVLVGLLAPRVWTPVSGLFEGQPIELAADAGPLRVFPARVIRSGHIASHVYAPGQLLAAMLRFRPDIVQVDEEVYSLASAQVALASRVLGKRVVVFGWENLDRAIHFSQRVSRLITLPLSNGVITGNSDAAKLVRAWGYHGPIATMPQVGVDLSHFDRALRRQGDVLEIGYVGRMVNEKGGDILLRAFATVAKAHEPVRLVLAGNGPEREAWRALSHELGIADRVTWLDVVPHDQVPILMARLGVLVLPSRSMPWWKEQFGLVLAQAMSMGIPVVGARSGAIPEVIGRDDLLFEEGDHAGLAEILQRLIGSRELRGIVSDWGYRRAKELYANEAVAERQLRFFLEIQDSQE